MAGCFLEMCFRGVDHRVGVMKMYLSLEISCRNEDDAVQKFCFCIEKSIPQCGGSCRVKKFDFPSFSHIITVRISLTFFLCVLLLLYLCFSVQYFLRLVENPLQNQ